MCLKATHPNRSEEAIGARKSRPKIGRLGSNFNSIESEKAFWAARKPPPEEANKEAEKLAKGTPVHPPLTSSPTPSDCQYSVETDNPFVNKSPSDCQYSVKTDNLFVNNSPRNQTSSNLLLPLEIVSSVNPAITFHIEPDVLTTPC